MRGKKDINLNEISYALIPLSLIYLPKVIKFDSETIYLSAVMNNLNPNSLVAASITYSINYIKNRREHVTPVKPIIISKISKPYLIDNKKAILRAASGVWKMVVNEFVAHLNKLGISTPRFRLAKPPLTLLIVISREEGDVIRAIISDGTEVRGVKLPVRVPSWRYTDIPDKIANEVLTVIVKPYINGKAYAPRGVFITGPPGVGKSVMAEAIISALRMKYVELNPSHYRSMWYGATEKILDALLSNIIKRRKEVALLIDDAEFISSRLYSIHEAHISEIITLLRYMQRPDRPFTIITANNPDLIDPALLRPGRIDVVIVLGYPDRELRRKVIKRSAKRYGIEFENEKLIDLLVKETKWFSNAEIDALVRLAASKGDGLITMESLRWAKRKFSINYIERKKVQEYLRWYANNLQGIKITLIPKDNEIG